MHSKPESEENGFTLNSSGRCGSITFNEHGKKLEICWEMSGVPDHDILLGPVDFREWTFPAGEKLTQAKQKDILDSLRQWLVAQGIRTNIDVPDIEQLSEEKCMWAECRNRAVRGIAYCPEHIDFTTLRR
jgi:hypothetical protein